MNFKDLNIEEKYKTYKEKNVEELFENLKAKVDSKNSSKKEYKEYEKIRNLKDNSYIIENLINYINDLKKEIIKLEEEKEKRQIYRELQKKELYIIANVKFLDEKITDLKKNYSEEDLEEEEKIILENRIKANIEKNETLKKELEVIKKQLNEMEPYQNKKIYSYEEQKNEIFKIKEKMYHAAIVLDYLLKGKSWDETLEYYLEWQKRKYKLNSNDTTVIKEDIKKIQYDTKIGNNIVKIAHNFDEIKEKKEERE